MPWIKNLPKFNWICDTAVIPASSISTAVFMCGLFFGAMGLGNLSDAIGRRKVGINKIIFLEFTDVIRSHCSDIILMGASVLQCGQFCLVYVATPKKL